VDPAWTPPPTMRIKKEKRFDGMITNDELYIIRKVIIMANFKFIFYLEELSHFKSQSQNGRSAY
jgi:hypothetical protein